MIYAENVCKHFGDRHRKVIALDHVNLQMQAGESVAIIGRSGSGKTTLLNLLAGLDRPTSGRLEVAGSCLGEFGRKQMANYRRQSVGFVFQAFQLIPQRTALQNIELPMILNGLPRGERRGRSRKLLQRVGLLDRADHHPYQLSGGEQQRVSIARALANEPAIVLADEPTGNLDTKSAIKIMDLLAEVCTESNVTFVLVTHDRALASSYSSRELIMSDGRLQEQTAA